VKTAVVLALASSLCTATSSVCQRLGAKAAGPTSGFRLGLLLRLLRHPIWLAGVGSMILGFVFQVSALHFGDLSLVQPILATELLFVFAYMSVVDTRRVKRRDWLAVTAMAVGLGLFLFIASPSGGRLHAAGSSWWLAGLISLGVVAAATCMAFGWGRSERSSSRRAAILGVATGISWGFVAAVIKELSSHINAGVGAIVSNWSLYVLLGAGAASMLLASHALSAGPLAASQPGFTIVDPLAASLLGLFLFRERVQVTVPALAGEAIALAVLAAGVVTLSHSQLIESAETPPERAQSPRAPRQDTMQEPAPRAAR
jgi:drug/metabolite transporter (DMT)-like permease